MSLEEEERQMEWNTTWEDPLTSYVKHFDGLIGDQRTHKTFGEIGQRHHRSRQSDLPTDCGVSQRS